MLILKPKQGLLMVSFFIAIESKSLNILSIATDFESTLLL